MAKIIDLVRAANEQYAKTQKTKESIERVRESLTTISKLAQLKGKT